MLVISAAALEDMHAHRLSSWRQQTVLHWQAEMPKLIAMLDESTCQEVLDDVEAASRDDTALGFAELTALADLMLVDRANAARVAAGR